jgi:hypothetical protein
VVKTQIAFINYAVQPLWGNFATLFPAAKFALANLLENLKAYEEVTNLKPCRPQILNPQP